MPRGGYRESNPGGRPKNLIPTKVVRLAEPIAIKAKDGTYERLEGLIKDWKIRHADTPNPDSRDWTQFKKFMEEIEEILNPETTE